MPVVPFLYFKPVKMSIEKEEKKINFQSGFVLLLTKVNAIGLLTHSYQKSCALRGSSVHKTRIYNLEKKFGVWALPNEKRCTYIHHACENSNRAKHSLNFRRNVTVSQDKYNNQVLC